MKKVLNAEIDAGIDSLMRIIGTLRRKDFNIVEVELRNSPDSGKTSVAITLEERVDEEATSARNYMEKIFGVRNITITH